MKSCAKTREQLSAYLDNELPPEQRVAVEAHLASCARCREELAELRHLAGALAELPKLQRTPQLLSEVRRKIARGDEPEPWNWHDYLLRPFWIKVPLEIAALLMVTLALMRSQSPAARENGKLAKIDREEGRAGTAEQMESDRRTALAQKPAPKAYDEISPSAAPPARTRMVRSGSESKEADTFDASRDYLADKDASEMSAGQPSHSGEAGNGGPALVPEMRRVPSVWTANASVSDGTSSPLALSAPGRRLGTEQPRLADALVVHAPNANEVRAHVEYLAAKCNGTIIPGPPSQSSTEEVFFVEIPRQYAASFKLDLLRGATNQFVARNAPGSNGLQVAFASEPATSVSSPAAVGGTLIGSMETNHVGEGVDKLGLAATNAVAEPSSTLFRVRIVSPPAEK